MSTDIASTSSTTQNHNAMTWYACGQALRPGKLDDNFQSMALDQVKNAMPNLNLVPTTYEAAKAYLDEESKKPQGERDLRREMCVMVPLGVPKDRKVYLAVPAVKSIFPLFTGSTMILPTIELPPDSFGSRGQIGILNPKNTGDHDHAMLIYDPPTDVPQKGTIVLSYLTRVGPEVPVDSSVDAVRLDDRPYT